MSKYIKQNSITNQSEISSKSVNSLPTVGTSNILLGNKTNRGKIKILLKLIKKNLFLNQQNIKH